MAMIIACGKTKYGKGIVTIKGNTSVKRVSCRNKKLKAKLEEMIANGEGYIANGYNPDPGTMLQAFACMTRLFDYQSVVVFGDIGTIPQPHGADKRVKY